MSCDVGKATEELENELWRTVGKATEGLENDQCRRWSDGSVGEWARSFYNASVTSHTSQLIHQPFRNPSVALPTSQLILQLFRRFTYATVHSPTLLSLLLRHRLFAYITWRAANGGMDSKDEDKISGHSTVEQATTVSFTEMEEGVTPLPSTS